MIDSHLETNLLHDMKQPIHVIRLTLENLSERILQDGVDRGYCIKKLAQIENQVDKLSIMLENIVDQ
jgi:hypothetical protein